MSLGTTDAVRELLTQNPNMSNSDLCAALPDHNKATVRTVASRLRGEGSSPEPAEDVQKLLIEDHLAGKITAEQLSAALHMRGRIETQRRAFVDVMIRANNMANALAIATTEEELTKALHEKNAIIMILGGANVTPQAPQVPPVPQAPSIAA